MRLKDNKQMKPKFKRFNNLTPKDINFDFHIHTNQTDGFCSAEEMIDQAINLKLKAIAITEHVDKSSDWFNNFAARIEILRNNNKIKILLGIETKVLDFNGTIDATANAIAKSDIVIGSVHRYPDGQGGFVPLEKIRDLGQSLSAKTEFNLAMGLLKNKKVDVLGHPFGVYSKLFGVFPEDYLEQLLIKSLENKIAVEINTKYIVERDLFFKLFRKINPYVSIGSDAHHKEELARSFDIIREEIKK